MDSVGKHGGAGAAGASILSGPASAASAASRGLAGDSKVALTRPRVCQCGDHGCAKVREDIPKGKGASGRWLDETPKRSWVCVDIKDLEAAHKQCEMCKREEIRYVHVMHHEGFSPDLKVGCICAYYMEGGSGEDAKGSQAEKRQSAMLTR